MGAALIRKYRSLRNVKRIKGRSERRTKGGGKIGLWKYRMTRKERQKHIGIKGKRGQHKTFGRGKSVT